MKPKKLALILSLAILLCLIWNVSAVVDFSQLINKIKTVVCDKIYKVVAGVIGAVAAIMIVIAGLKWIASENDPSQRKQAKDMMIMVLIGLILLAIGYQLIGDMGFTPCPSTSTP